jgi:uncharacterized protein
MSTKRRQLRGRGVVGGVVSGPAVVSLEPIVWSHGVDPGSGRIVDVGVPIRGQSIADRVFVYPHGKGSTTSSTWMLETIRRGHGPCAVINRETEMIVAVGAVLGELLYQRQTPIVDQLDADPLEVIATGDWVTVDGDRGIVEVVKRSIPPRAIGG